MESESKTCEPEHKQATLSDNTLKRIRNEFNLIKQCNFEEISISLLNLSHVSANGWHVTVQGPKNTPYVNGFFEYVFMFDSSYPKKPPHCNILTRIYHPDYLFNKQEVNPVRLPSLENNNYNPSISMANIVLEILDGFSNPHNFQLNKDAYQNYINNKEEYKKLAKYYTEKHATHRSKKLVTKMKDSKNDALGWTDLLYFVGAVTLASTVTAGGLMFYGSFLAGKQIGKGISRIAYFIGCDRHTELIIKMAVKCANSWEKKTMKDLSLPLKCEELQKKDIQLCGIKLAAFDEDVEDDYTITKSITDFLMTNPIVTNGIKDIPSLFKNNLESIKFRKDTFSNVIPKMNINYQELRSNESITRICFAGIACQYVKRLDSQLRVSLCVRKAPKYAVYVADFSSLMHFEVREGFERYGAIAYFDKNQRLLGIYVCFNNKYYDSNKYKNITTNDENQILSEWDYAKWILKTTIITQITIKDHLLITHLIESNSLVVTVRENLPITHPLRIFLKPYTYRTLTINMSALSALLTKFAITHRLFSFKWSSVIEFLDTCKKNYKFKYFNNYIHPSIQKDNNINEYNCAPKHDTMTYWNITKQFVSNFFDIYYPNNSNNIFKDIYSNLKNDGRSINIWLCKLTKLLGIDVPTTRENLINIISQLICNSTSIHQQVGSVTDYFQDIYSFGVKIRKKNDKNTYTELCQLTQQDYAQTLSLIVFTGLEQPKLMQDWSHIFENMKNNDEMMKKYTIYKFKLNRLATYIERNNKDEKKRKYPFCSFNPNLLESSVSV